MSLDKPKEVVTKTTTKPKPVAKVEKKENISLKARLQKARVALKKIDIPKSGINTFRGNKYYTLDDILPPITKIAEEFEMTTRFSFDKDNAELTLLDWYTDDTITFNLPMPPISEDDNEKGNKKKDLNQILGSSITYQKRYLLTNAFDISDEEKETYDNIDNHDIMVVKQRIEIKMTELMKRGYDINEVIKLIGLKDEKQYLGYLSACGTLNTIEKNMRVLLNKKKED